MKPVNLDKADKINMNITSAAGDITDQSAAAALDTVHWDAILDDVYSDESLDL